MMKREASKDGSLTASKNSRMGDTAPEEASDDGEFLDYDCLICTNAIDIFGIFDCGHYCCAICAIRIYKFGTKAADRCCPMCRSQTKHLRVVQFPPMDEYQFDMGLLNQKALYQDKILKISIESKELRDRLEKLYSFVCPLSGCWDQGIQDPFQQFSGLKEHLSKEHKLRYCNLCIEHRPSFLCEQITYNDNEHDSHNRGKCHKDPLSFLGHPLCLWCRQRFYDGDHLLKHMQSAHFCCDVCNRGEFTFVFYKNRNKLIDHFDASHVLCHHADCVNLDPMLRVFASDLELVAHQQKEHGAAAKGVSLDALGFDFGGGNPRERRGVGQSPPPAGPAVSVGDAGLSENPATGRDVTASLIWFDNVHSGRESVNLMPKTKHRTTTAEVSQKPNNEVMLASQVIPVHFETRETLEGVKRIQSKIQAPEPPAATKPTEQKKDDGKLADDLSPEEYNAILKDKLPKFLPKKDKFEEFKQASADFLGNKLMATEYYTKLATYFFSAEQMEQIFEPLAYSLTNPTKRAALIAARKMMTSKESQVRIEHERKVQDEAAAQLKREKREESAGWKRLGGQPPVATVGKKPVGSAAAGAAKTKKNVWSQKSQERTKPSMQQDNFALQNSMPASLIGGGSTAPPPPVAVLNSRQAFARLEEQHVDPEMFPTLAQDTKVETTWGKKKKGGKLGGATFTSNNTSKKGPPGSTPSLPGSGAPSGSAPLGGGSTAKKVPAKANPWFRE